MATEAQTVGSDSRRGDSSPRAALSAGAVIGGRYEIMELAGEAAFGTLYRAKTRTDGTIVTIELLDPRLFGDQRVRASVRQELEALSGLEHKNLATPIYFADEVLPTGTMFYIVFDHLDGQSLADMHAKKRAAGKPFSLKGAYNVVAHLANGLLALHGFTVGHAPHGGLSMRSIHVSSQGRVKVLELGLARALLASGARGVVAQVVPELAPELSTSPDRVDARADVFAVGAILYELLAGKAPELPPAPASTVVAGLPRAIDQFLEACLQPTPEARYPDMGRLKEALQGAVGPELGGASQAAVSASQLPAASRPATPVMSSAPTPRPGAARRRADPEVLQRRLRALLRRRGARALAHPEGQARLRPVQPARRACADRGGQDPRRPHHRRHRDRRAPPR